VDSEVEVTGGSGLTELFNGVPDPAFGTTPTIGVPQTPGAVELGDILEFYDDTGVDGDYRIPADSHVVVGTSVGTKTLEVDPAVSVERASFAFSLSAQVPFVRVRKKVNNNYTVLRAALVEWLALGVNQATFFRELDRLVNIVLRADNPTLEATSAVTARVAQLVDSLTGTGGLDSILEAYEARGEARVDTLVESFRQKGAGRAVNILLEARFSEFFGVSAEESSYLGATLRAIRGVQANDLPVRKTQRGGLNNNAVVLATYEEPDAEFDLSDIQDAGTADIPGMSSSADRSNVY